MAIEYKTNVHCDTVIFQSLVPSGPKYVMVATEFMKTEAVLLRHKFYLLLISNYKFISCTINTLFMTIYYDYLTLKNPLDIMQNYLLHEGKFRKETAQTFEVIQLCV